MTPLHRYLAVLQGRQPDVVPRVPILMQFAAEFIGSDYGAFASDHRVLVEANLACAEHFGFDQVSCISDPYRETEGFGGEVTFVSDGVPRCTAPMASSKDLGVLLSPDPLVSVRMRDRVSAVHAYARRAEKHYSILGWVEGPAAEASTLRSPVNFLMDLYDDPDFLQALMDVCLDNAVSFALAQIEAGADTVGIGDAIASQISPAMYERLVAPREKVLVEAIQDAGAAAKLHICGDITHLLPGIAGLGVDILDVDHMVDLKAVRLHVGDDVVLTGNIDPVAGVKQGSPESIRRKIQSCREEAGARYLVNAGCEIPSGTPNANLEALCAPVPA